MTEPPQYPANRNHNAPAPPSSTSSQSQLNDPFTPHSASIADDSDADYDPTPIHSPGGPQYDDLPPSYNEAQQQAVHDAHGGIAPVDPNQIEAHRLTLSEHPNGPEIWEYRIRGDQLDGQDENEQAPEYGAHMSPLASTIPVQHVQSSENIPVGRTHIPGFVSNTTSDWKSTLLSTALQFACHEPDVDVQYAPRLSRCIAIPQEGLPAPNRRDTNSNESVQILRAYAKVLHAHSVRPAEFAEFLDGLNTLCRAINAASNDLLSRTSHPGTSSSIVHEYIRRANDTYFAPRGLRVMVNSLSTLLKALDVPPGHGPGAGAVGSFVESTSNAERRARALYPWIEALDANVPLPSARTLVLRDMAKRQQSRVYADPPHSMPEPIREPYRGHGWRNLETHGLRGRSRHRGGPWSAFGTPGNSPFNVARGGLRVLPGQRPLEESGNGPVGRHPFGPAHRGRGHPSTSGGRSYPARPGNDWTALGKDIGKWGEEFGKRMGDWGEEFGKTAGAWGQDVGRRASAWGEDVSARASGSGTGVDYVPGRSVGHTYEDLPPSYTQGPRGQETGVLRTAHEVDDSGFPQMYDNHKNSHKGKNKVETQQEDDDDLSSISSSSSSFDLDSDSDSDTDDDVPDTEDLFLARLRSINKEADIASRKGKKSTEEIARERAIAIEVAQAEQIAMEHKMEGKLIKRVARRELKHRGRELKREHGRRKREMRAAHDGKIKGKKKGKAKGSKEWKDAKREYREKKKALRKEKLSAKKEWREARSERRRFKREAMLGAGEQANVMHGMVWVVIENLGP